LPASFDFGTVTMGNEPAPLEVKVNSTGTANLSVSSIAISGDTGSIILDRNQGSAPCGTSATIAPGGNCTFEVRFSPVSVDTFSANVRVSTNAGNIDIPIEGASLAVSALTVRINQAVPDCGSNIWTAYVSVTDQAGYPFPGLEEGDFEVTVGGVIGIDMFDGPPIDYTPSPISVVAVMDYSNSITDHPEIVNDMEEGLVEFIEEMGATDQVAIVKFNSAFEVIAFTSDKAALATAIRAPFANGDTTRLYDAIDLALDQFEGVTTPRKAIVLLTDGLNRYSGAVPPLTVDDVIAYAQTRGVPLFPIGLGNPMEAGALEALEQMAEGTGGEVYQAPTSDSLRNSYWQLRSVVFEKQQYVLQLNGLADSGLPADLTVEVLPQGPISGGTDTKAITLCD
jgi:hypothetical protein